MGTSRDMISNLLPVVGLAPIQLEMLDTITTDDASALVRYLFRECKNSPEARFVLPALFKVVESSDRSLAKWVRELIEVFSWLEARNSSARFKDILEYVSCAYEGSASEVGHSIAWYLEQYGFEKRLER